MLTRLFSACSLAIVLIAAAPAHAYRIVEGKYRVEIAPDVFQDQLVVRCDNGRELTLPWESDLRKACGESLLGSSEPEAAKPARAISEKAAAPRMASPVTDFTSSFEVQKRMHLTRLRVQFGEVPEQLVTFHQGPDGISPRFAPELAEILDRFEACRSARGTDCVAVRNAAYAGIRGSTAQAAKPALPTARARQSGPAASTAAPRPARRVRHTAEPRVIREAPGALRPAVAHSSERPTAALDKRPAAKGREPVAEPEQVVHTR